MRRWVPRPIDLAAAAVLTVATQVELWLLEPEDVPLAGRVTVPFAVGTLAFAWHRVAPLTALTVGLTGLTVVPRCARRRPRDWPSAGSSPRFALAGVGRLPRPASRCWRWRSHSGCWRSASCCRRGWLVADVLYAWLLAGGVLARRTGRRRPDPAGRALGTARGRRRGAGAVAGRRGRGGGAAADRPGDARRRLAQRQRHDAARQRGPPAAAPRPGGGARGAGDGGAHRPGVPGRDAPDARGPPRPGARRATPRARASPGWRSCSIPARAGRAAGRPHGARHGPARCRRASTWPPTGSSRRRSRTCSGTRPPAGSTAPWTTARPRVDLRVVDDGAGARRGRSGRARPRRHARTGGGRTGARSRPVRARTAAGSVHAVLPVPPRSPLRSRRPEAAP